MGRIDPTSGHPTRPPGSRAGWIVAGVLAAVLVALVAFEIGKRSHVDREAPAAVAMTPLVAVSQAPPSAPSPASLERQVPASPAPQEGRVERAVMEVTIPPPAFVRELASEQNREPTPAPAEALHDAMARCLSFTAEDDEIHAVSMPYATQVRVTVANRCDFSFPGSDVWFEARAVPRHNDGTSAREVGRFLVPIEARGRTEVVIVLSCPMCYAATHRLEVGLSWPPDGRQ